MNIRLNGEPYDVAGPLPISELLAALDIDPRRVAVEHNLAVVKKESYGSTIVNPGDEVEIVNFVGGGAAVPLRTDNQQSADGTHRASRTPDTAPRSPHPGT